MSCFIADQPGSAGRRGLVESKTAPKRKLPYCKVDKRIKVYLKRIKNRRRPKSRGIPKRLRVPRAAVSKIN